MNDNTSLGSPFVGGRNKRNRNQRNRSQRNRSQRNRKQNNRTHMQRKRTQRQRKSRQTRNKNGGMWSNVINQAVVPFSILAMQQNFRKKPRKNNKTMRSRR